MTAEQPATKSDLTDLKVYMAEREITSIRWFVATFVGIQIAYVFGTMAAIWFLLREGH